MRDDSLVPLTKERRRGMTTEHDMQWISRIMRANATMRPDPSHPNQTVENRIIQLQGACEVAIKALRGEDERERLHVADRIEAILPCGD